MICTATTHLDSSPQQLEPWKLRKARRAALLQGPAQATGTCQETQKRDSGTQNVSLMYKGIVCVSLRPEYGPPCSMPAPWGIASEDQSTL